ncbi:hypothetical protein FNV43_RR13411 [Rhamnella rubrinervis]|uniref:Peroxidase n=1 Tax=Rhamnella rubrinervis TaxID=2594499 RepID=A0A8K0MF57_9ROSA|nr:hypothetical protein FNV43_RR13411 [Rhamnella rubrinervis]
MAIQKLVSVLFLQFLLLVLVSDSTHAQYLRRGFYQNTCPDAESIIWMTTQKYISRAPTLAASLLRMHFHDCFVRGCDGSVLLKSTSNNQAEKDAVPNLSLRGFDVIDAVKSAVEYKCPGAVSCADILALVARDAVSMINGPFWEVPTGRRDGRVSLASEALTNLPPPFAFISQLKSMFSGKGLSVKDLVVLSGAHTIGVSHCSSFQNRLYNFTGVGDQDPSLDSEYAANLKANKCRSPNDNTTKVEMDPGSRGTFDLSYFTLLLKRRGLFQSDAALTTSSTTKSFIQQLVQGSLQDFFAEFANSMEKMGRINVKTGTEGEIRKVCALVNS